MSETTQSNIETTDETITLTSTAAAAIKRLIDQQEDNNGLMLRISVKGGGCSGLTYDMAFDREVGEFDKTFDFEGVTVVVDLKSLTYMGGTTIDFSDEILSGGFKFSNPKSSRGCGCGTSFSV